MSRYIDADTFQKFLEDEIEETKLDKENGCGDEYYEMAVGARECALREMLSKLKREPTADAREVKHARWETVGNYKVECTNCHHIRDIKTQCGWNFCPHCGAKIDLEEDENE